MPGGPRKKIFLLSSGTPALKHLKQTTDPGSEYTWVYLGKNVGTSRKIQQFLGDNFRRLFIGDLIQETARAARKEYIEFTGALLSSTHSPIWFLSSLSERSPFISTFLLFYSYVEAGKRLVGQIPAGSLVIICESSAVLDTLAKAISEYQETCSIEVINTDAGKKTALCSRILRKTLKKCWFISRFTSRIFIARLFRAVKGHSNLEFFREKQFIVLHSWTDARSFKTSGRFTNTYFGEIGEALEKKWPSFLYLSDVLPTYWYPRAVLKHLKGGNNVYLMEEFLSIKDLLTASIISSRDYPVPSEVPLFRNMDVSALVNDEIERDRLDTRLEQTLLYSCASKRLCRLFDVGLFLYTFEHHIWEKMFCQAIKKVKPSATIAAYAIIFINSMYTCYSLSEADRSEAPLPDVIFVSGEQGRSMLIQSGFKGEMIQVGGAIRYPNFLSHVVEREKVEGNSILVAPSGELNSSLELIYKAMDAFSGYPDAHVTIKCHPTIPYSLLSRFLPPLPDSFSVTDTPIERLLPESDLVLYTESTVCVEAAAAGVPILHVRSDHLLDINIFEHNPAVPSCSDPKEIRKQSEEILRGKYILPSLSTLKQLFSHADKDAIVSAFVDLLGK